MNYDKFKQFESQALNTVYREEVGGFHDELIPQIAQRFLPEFKIKKSARILDIGCGPGIFMQAAKDLGYKNTIGITLSKEDVDMCLDSGHNAVLSSMTDLPYKDSSVDFIWCRHALEHSPYPLFTLFEFHRVLCSGGQAFIEIPAPNNERAYMHEFNPNHYSILGDRMWMALFDKAKFECWAMWNYDINLPFENGTVNEKSYMFAVKKL